MGSRILKKFYSCTVERFLTGCITAWYDNCSASNSKAVQRVMRTAQYITGANLPFIQDLYRLFSLLLHGKRYWSTKSRSKRLLNSFYPQAVRLLNS